MHTHCYVWYQTYRIEKQWPFCTLLVCKILDTEYINNGLEENPKVELTKICSTTELDK